MLFFGETYCLRRFFGHCFPNRMILREQNTAFCSPGAANRVVVKRANSSGRRHHALQAREAKWRVTVRYPRKWEKMRAVLALTRKMLRIFRPLPRSGRGRTPRSGVRVRAKPRLSLAILHTRAGGAEEGGVFAQDEAGRD